MTPTVVIVLRVLGEHVKDEPGGSSFLLGLSGESLPDTVLSEQAS